MNFDNNKKWLAVYTRPRWEKKVNLLLEQKGMDAFCPLVKTRKKWADRYKTVEVPLFSSYIFAHINPKQQLLLKQTAGVVGLIHHCGVPAEITADEIERVKYIVREESVSELEAISLQQMSVGDRLTIKAGVLKDWEGDVVRFKGKSVVMLLKQFDCALVAKINVGHENLVGV